MQAAIYVQILSDQSYSYEKPVLTWLKQHFPQLVCFDFDTHSDRQMAVYAMELLEKAGKAVVIFETTDGPPTGLLAFMEKIIACRDKCLVLLYGKNELAERMLQLLDSDRVLQVDNKDELISSATAFLLAGGH